MHVPSCLLLGCCCSAGGGGGGNGGGGGGGLIFRPSFPVTPGATFAVEVGGGGTGGGGPGTPNLATAGGRSSFGTDFALVAIGGGAGAASGRSSAGEGGSGGGGAAFNPDNSFFPAVDGGVGTPSQGESRRPHVAHTCTHLQVNAISHRDTDIDELTLTLT
jgi:hypothetical protein